MAQTITIVICIFFNLLSSLVISSSLRLKLTHRDSPNSPLYQSNLSDFERFNKNVEISKARASYFHQFRIQNTSLRVPLTYHEFIYTVDIGLGTPATKRTLIFDTGSYLTWTQCKPCIKCFKQKQPLFNIKRSSSYRLMSRMNKLSKGFECDHIGCVYIVKYYSGQFSTGVLSLEDFTFGTSTAGVSRKVLNMVFGCGTYNHGNFGETKAVSGILGMDKEPVSFAGQLGARIKNRFSYCLTKIDSKNIKESYLRFGEEAVIKGVNARSTPFLRAIPNSHYILKLNDISIGGRKLGLELGTFPVGCVIDSGSSISLLNEKTFSQAEKLLTVYFSRFKNIRRLVGKGVPEGLICYKHLTRGVFRNFPNMTYHFEGADFDVPWENAFVMFEDEAVCFAAMKSGNVTILGAHQQRNVRVVYDLKYNKLSFAPEDCSRDAA